MTTRKSLRLSFHACIAATAVCLAAGAIAAAPPEAGACRALLVGGLPGTPIGARHHRDWLKRFHSYLTQAAKVPPANVVVLSGDKDFKDAIVNGFATADSVRKALADAAKVARPTDQFILFLVGLGVTTERVPTFVLQGPDITARELAAGLNAIAARNQVVLNFSASSGSSTPMLSREGRVVVAANMPTQNVPPVYAEFFLRGLETKRADGEAAPDGGEKDGVVTVLEAYNWAAFQTAQWIARQHKTGENVWRLDGRESVEVFRKLYESASNEGGCRTLDPASKSDAPDAIVKLKAAGEPAVQEMAKSKRRVITEHAALEDCGAEEPVSALGDEKKDYAPLAGKGEAEPGFLARRTVIGRPDLLPAKGN